MASSGAGSFLAPAKHWSLRPLLWWWHLALPLGALWLLRGESDLDAVWEHHAGHLWIVLATAVVELVVAIGVHRSATERADARLLLVSLSFATSAAFLGLHALSTPDELLGRNAGFDLATPFGLTLAGLGCAWSAIEFSEGGSERVVAAMPRLRAGVVGVVGVWGVVSLGGLPPLSDPLDPGVADAWLYGMLAVGGGGFVAAAAGYWRLRRRRPAQMIVSAITAFALLAETLAIIALSLNWHLSWWLWHALMAIAFLFMAYSAQSQWRREGTSTALFGGMALERTVASLRAEHRAALQSLADAMADGGIGDSDAQRLAVDYDLSDRQRSVLVDAASALAAERRQIRRQRAIVALGEQASVVRGEAELVDLVESVLAEDLAPDDVRLRLVRDGGRDPEPTTDPETFRLPIRVKGTVAGVLEVRTSAALGERDRSLYESLASHLGVSLENARLYEELRGLFHTYLSPEVASALVADPDQAALGGSIVEVSVLMADLSGCTPFSEREDPPVVVEMLNTHYSAVVPEIVAEGGTVIQFVGDAIMAIFNAPIRQPDHATRAGRAALAMQRVTSELVAERPGWPRFRVGVNTGPALVGNVGAREVRSFTAIGDTTNVAARLESVAEPGSVVVGGSTWHLLDPAARRGVSMGAIEVKGRDERVDAYRLDALASG